jgi:hypothetical protein
MELAACPGPAHLESGKGHLDFHAWDIGMNVEYQVACTCGIAGPNARGKAKAAKLWNEVICRRTPSALSREEVERTAEILAVGMQEAFPDVFQKWEKLTADGKEKWRDCANRILARHVQGQGKKGEPAAPMECKHGVSLEFNCNACSDAGLRKKGEG